MTFEKLGYTPNSWKEKTLYHIPIYKDSKKLESVELQLESFPPLVSPLEINELRDSFSRVAEGKAFILQGGDCAETFKDFSTEYISNTFKEFLTMAIILTFSSKKEVIRVGRFAGQFAKPRSQELETIDGVTLPTYRGDMINNAGFNPSSREPDPEKMITAYFHSAATLNYLRSFSRGKYLQIDEVFESIIERLSRSENLVNGVQILARATKSLEIIKTSGESRAGIPMRSKLIDFYTSHEALLLNYETPLTRVLGDKYYCSSAHMLWLGERTRKLDGAHVEFLKGVINPIGIKCGPNTNLNELITIIRTLNPLNETGKIVLIPRFGAENITSKLPLLIKEIIKNELSVIWLSDPMHGNTKILSGGTKTRFISDIIRELEIFFQTCKSYGVIAGGIHLEMTGKHVTECAENLDRVNELNKDYYESNCDPRLNGSQAVELAYRIAEFL